MTRSTGGASACRRQTGAPMAPMDERAEPVPISALQHAVFCLRQAALIHVEQVWAENIFTAEGRVLHEAADCPGERRRGVIRQVRAMALSCRRLNLAGVADLVEFREGPDGETPYPVEYKRGKPKTHRADEVQLCAQALCLEEMTGRPVPEGALFYGETRRRVVVPFDAGLRDLTETTARAFGDVMASGTTPPARYQASRCRSCSLISLCRPKESRKSALAYRSRTLSALLGNAGGDAA